MLLCDVDPTSNNDTIRHTYYLAPSVIRSEFRALL